MNEPDGLGLRWAPCHFLGKSLILCTSEARLGLRQASKTMHTVQELPNFAAMQLKEGSYLGITMPSYRPPEPL